MTDSPLIDQLLYIWGFHKYHLIKALQLICKEGIFTPTGQIRKVNWKNKESNIQVL